MAEVKTNTLHDQATNILEVVVNRWAEAGQPLDPLMDVLVSVAVDLNVRALGERTAAAYFRDVANTIHVDDGEKFDA